MLTATRDRRQGVGLLVLLCLIIAGTGCSAPDAPQSGLSHPPNKAQRPPKIADSSFPADLDIAHRIDKPLRVNFALLSGHPEGLPKRLAHLLYPGLGVGANWALAQRLPGISPAVWAVPGRGRVCLVESIPSGNAAYVCTLTRRALKRGAYIALVPTQKQDRTVKRVIVGLAPDGVRDVRLHTPGSPSRITSVNHNVFVLRDRGVMAPEWVEFIQD